MTEPLIRAPWSIALMMAVVGLYHVWLVWRRSGERDEP